MQSEDAFLVLWMPEEDAATAAREVLIRAREALEGIPAETRQAHADGTTGFERILPGPDRMYPDTDTPPLPLADSMVAEVRAHLGESPWARRARYEALGLDTRSAEALSTAPWADLFDELNPEEGETARRVAAVFEKRIPHHARKNRGHKPRRKAEVPEARHLAPLVRAFEAGEIRPEALAWGMDEILASSDPSPEEVLARYRPRPEDEEELPRVLAAVAQEARKKEDRSLEACVRFGMGEVMGRFFGRIDPREVRERLTNLLSSEKEEAVAWPMSQGDPS